MLAVPYCLVPKDAVKVFRRLLSALGLPWRQAKRGRPPKHSPRDYAAALFCRAFWGWTFRESECVLGIDAPPPTVLLADLGYDAESIYRLAYQRGWRVNMRQRRNCASRTGVRGRVWRSFNASKYRALRGRVEAPFGGFARRYGSRINERKTSTRRRACLLRVAAHNIRTLAQPNYAELWDTLSITNCLRRGQGGWLGTRVSPCLGGPRCLGIRLYTPGIICLLEGDSLGGKSAAGQVNVLTLC